MARHFQTFSCFVEGCPRPFYAKGLCRHHYDNKRRNGKLEPLRVRAPDGDGGYANGYKLAYTETGRREYEHILIAEKALGHYLPEGAVVHHVTEDRTDNHGPFKLVICPDQAYHLLIHRLMRERGISFKEG